MGSSPARSLPQLEFNLLLLRNPSIQPPAPQTSQYSYEHRPSYLVKILEHLLSNHNNLITETHQQNELVAQLPALVPRIIIRGFIKHLGRPITLWHGNIHPDAFSASLVASSIQLNQPIVQLAALVTHVTTRSLITQPRRSTSLHHQPLCLPLQSHHRESSTEPAQSAARTV